MKATCKSSTKVGTLRLTRHESAIRALTFRVAPNIRPPLLKMGIPQSIVARSIIYAVIAMRIDSHSSRLCSVTSLRTRTAASQRKRPAAQSSFRHLRPRTLSSQPSFDATTAKLCVINVVPQHNPAADQQLSGDCNFRFRLATSLSQPHVKLPELLVESDCYMASFSQQVSQQPRTGFAYSEIMFSFCARTFPRFKADVSDDRFLPVESIKRLQSVNHSKSSQHANPRMSHQQLDSVVGGSLLLQPLLNSPDPLVNRDQKREQVFGLMLNRWCHAGRLQSLLPGTAEHPRSFRQAAIYCNGLQVVTDHRPHLYQPRAVPQHSQRLNTFRAVTMDSRESPLSMISRINSAS